MILATVYLLHNLIISSKFIFESHSELNTISVLSLSSIFVTWFKYVSADFLVSSKVKAGLVLFFPDGSPIIAVKSPITKTTLCPISWNDFNTLNGTECPICKSGLDGSAPNFIVNFFPFFYFCSNSSSEKICTVFLFIISILFIIFTPHNIIRSNTFVTIKIVI